MSNQPGSPPSPAMPASPSLKAADKPSMPAVQAPAGAPSPSAPKTLIPASIAFTLLNKSRYGLRLASFEIKAGRGDRLEKGQLVAPGQKIAWKSEGGAPLEGSVQFDVVDGSSLLAAWRLAAEGPTGYHLLHGIYGPDGSQAADEVPKATQDGSKTSVSFVFQPQQRMVPPVVNHALLADLIYAAGAGQCGTDEVGIYRALELLENNPAAVKELTETYKARKRRDLKADMESELGGGELEYALQLIKEGREKEGRKSGFVQRVQVPPVTASGYLADALRLYEAGPNSFSTKDEAIYAVLGPLAGKPGMETLAKVYEREHKSPLGKMLNKQMSGERLEHALELFELPRGDGGKKSGGDGGKEANDDVPQDIPAIPKLIQEAREKLFPKKPSSPDVWEGAVNLGVWWERKANGVARFDETYWVFEDEAKYKKNVKDTSIRYELTMKPGVVPHVAVDAIFAGKYEWEMDCGEFVQLVLLYARRKLLRDDAAFDRWATSDFKLTTHGSRNGRHALFLRAERDHVIPLDTWYTAPCGRIDKLSEKAMLANATLGCRVRWKNSWSEQAGEFVQDQGIASVSRLGWFAFQHENTVKIGPDEYLALGLQDPIINARKVKEDMVASTREMVAYMLSGAVNLKGAPEIPYNSTDTEIAERIYVDQIEAYRWEDVIDKPA